MRKIIIWTLLLMLQIACSQEMEREESYDQDDLRGKDNFKRSVPVENKNDDFGNGFQSHE